MAFAVNPTVGVHFYNRHCFNFQGNLERNTTGPYNTHKWTTYEIPEQHTPLEKTQIFFINASLSVLTFFIQLFEFCYSSDGKKWRAVERELAPAEHLQYLRLKFKYIGLLGQGKLTADALRRSTNRIRLRDSDSENEDEESMNKELLKMMRIEMSDTILASIQSGEHMEQTHQFLGEIPLSERAFLEGLMLHHLDHAEKEYYLESLAGHPIPCMSPLDPGSDLMSFRCELVRRKSKCRARTGKIRDI